jgi:hypothetical protein
MDARKVSELCFFSSELEEMSPAPSTVLYPIRPFGGQTGQREALDCYIQRLSHAHRLRFSVLYSQVLHPRLSLLGHGHHPQRTFHLSASAFNGVGDVPAALEKVISELTGRTDVSFLNFCRLNHLLPALGLMSTELRFCPRCIREDGSLGSMYKRLLWDVRAVTVCPIHEIKLVTHGCGNKNGARKQTDYRNANLFGVCPTCGSVAYGCASNDGVPASEYDIWVSKETETLVEALPSLVHVGRSDLALGIRTVAHELGPTCVSRRLGVSKQLMSHWSSGPKRPTLVSLLNLCAIANKSLVSVIRGRPLPSKFTTVAIAPKRAEPRAMAGSATGEHREEALLDGIKRSRSLKQVAASLKLSDGALRNSHPQLSRVVVQTHQAANRARWEENAKVRRAKCEAALRDVKQDDFPMTLGTVQRLLKRRIFPNSVWAVAWITTLEEMGFKADAMRWQRELLGSTGKQPKRDQL